MLKVNFKRLISYHFRKFLFSRINYKNDPNFPGMDLLRKNGAIYLPKFSQNNLLSKQIIDSFESQKEIILSKEILKLDNKKGRYDYRSKITNYFDKDLLLSYAKQNFFIQFIGQYFGFVPKLRFVSIWLDRPKFDKVEKDSQLFHRDDDDAFLIKTFLCLTDINLDNGPFQMIKSSHRKPWIKNYFDNHEKITMTANKGDLYLADTNGFHRGAVLDKDFRVLLTAHYVSKFPKKKFLLNIID